MVVETNETPDQPVLAASDSTHVGDFDKKAKEESEPTSESELEEVDPGTVNERALIRKIDWRLLPAVGILYLLSFLDRSNVGNARIEGLADDLHMTGNQYLTGLTLYFIGYVIFEVSDSKDMLSNLSSPTRRDANLGSCPLGPLQYHTQEDHPSVLAANSDHLVGYCGHPDGDCPGPYWLLHCPLLLGCGRVWAVSRRCVLLLHVVQKAGKAVPHLLVLWRCCPCGLLWRHPGICEAPIRSSSALTGHD
jgi:hypothetical protein